MSAHFIQYRCFNELALAQELADTLKVNSIPYLLDDSNAVFDVSFANNELSKEYIIKLRAEDFNKVDQLLLKQAQNELDQVGQDHYLFQFTDAELIDIIRKPDEWSPLDYQLASKLLKDRNVDVNADAIKENRIKELSIPHKSQIVWIRIGYIALIILPMISVLVGYFLFNQKRTLPNGDRIYSYSALDRIHGRNLLFAGIVILVSFFVFRIYIKFVN